MAIPCVDARHRVFLPVIMKSLLLVVEHDGRQLLQGDSLAPTVMGDQLRGEGNIAPSLGVIPQPG